MIDCSWPNQVDQTWRDVPLSRNLPITSDMHRDEFCFLTVIVEPYILPMGKAKKMNLVFCSKTRGYLYQIYF